MNVPNLITIGRILLAPLTIWFITAGRFPEAFLTVIVAGVSDAADGFIAKRFDQATELGAYIDPLADKILLVSIYVSLGFLNEMPSWLVILAVSRDILILGAVILSWLMDKPVEVKPIMVSKVNTMAQIVLACMILGALAFDIAMEGVVLPFAVIVAMLTVISGANYMWQWMRHMANGHQDT